MGTCLPSFLFNILISLSISDHQHCAKTVLSLRPVSQLCVPVNFFPFSHCRCLDCFGEGSFLPLQVDLIFLSLSDHQHVYNLLTAPWTISNTYAQVVWAQSHANHVQNIGLLYVQHVVLRAMWYEGTVQLLSLTELKSHLFELYFIGWTINRWRRGGNRSTWRNPLATNFRKC